MMNPPIISNVWIEEMIASPSNFPIGLFLAYVSRVGLKKGFEKGVLVACLSCVELLLLP